MQTPSPLHRLLRTSSLRNSSNKLRIFMARRAGAIHVAFRCHGIDLPLGVNHPTGRRGPRSPREKQRRSSDLEMCPSAEKFRDRRKGFSLHAFGARAPLNAPPVITPGHENPLPAGRTKPPGIFSAKKYPQKNLTNSRHFCSPGHRQDRPRHARIMPRSRQAAQARAMPGDVESVVAKAAPNRRVARPPR